jgi:hypothetical protein
MRQILPTLHRIIALLVLAVAMAPAMPQQAAGRYTVEIIVFHNDETAPTGTSEAADTVAGVRGADMAAVPVSSRRLAGAATRLRGAKGYRVLAHTAWTQSASGWNSRRGVSTAALGLGGAGVQGKVILELGQYLHLGFDLTVEDGAQRYRLTEIRRVKPDEAQYFDHPAVGIIALVTAGG